VKNRPKICGSNVRKAMSKRNKMTYKLVWSPRKSHNHFRLFVCLYYNFTS
jgi:hypothetical protein